MRFRRPSASEPEIQLAPLIDVILLLLLFYSVAANFTQQSRLALELPRAGSGTAAAGSEALVVSVEADGRYAVNDRALTGTDVEALQRAIASELSRLGGEPAVTIVGDANAPHQAVVGAMDAARRLGIGAVRIATRGEGD